MKRLFGLLLALSTPCFGANLLATGEITSKDQHLISAPSAMSYQIQVQWLAKEGKLVEAGDVIAVFDGASTQAEIKRNEEQLVSLKLELQKMESDLTQQVLEASGKYKVADLNVDKALIEAGITSDKVSDYEKGQYKLTLERAVFSKVQAEQQLKKAQENKINKINKQKLEIKKLEEDIRYNTALLAKLEVKSQITGSVFYHEHPWTREKMSAGMMVQAGMQVLTVQGDESLQINAWLHELDAEKVKEEQPVTVSMDAYPQRAFKAKVNKVFTQSEQKQQWGNGAYYRIEIEFVDQPSMPISAGMSVRVQMEGK